MITLVVQCSALEQLSVAGITMVVYASKINCMPMRTRRGHSADSLPIAMPAKGE
jgi:hypothetical protein